MNIYFYLIVIVAASNQTFNMSNRFFFCLYNKILDGYFYSFLFIIGRSLLNFSRCHLLEFLHHLLFLKFSNLRTKFLHRYPNRMLDPDVSQDHKAHNLSIQFQDHFFWNISVIILTNYWPVHVVYDCTVKQYFLFPNLVFQPTISECIVSFRCWPKMGIYHKKQVHFYNSRSEVRCCFFLSNL